MFRDYVLVESLSRHGATVAPAGAPTVACPDYAISLPVLGPDGTMLAGRDETTGETTIFEVSRNGGCRLLVGLGLQSGKVAWDPTGRRIAFSLPQGVAAHSGGIGGGNDWSGVFVGDWRNMAFTRIARSNEMRALTFPEFAGSDSILVLAPVSEGERPRFRLICCLAATDGS